METAMNAPLVKSFALEIDHKAAEGMPSGTIVGYASTYGGKPDDYGDVVKRGFFEETIKSGFRNGDGVLPMLWQHNAAEPVGTWPGVEDNNKGLKLTGQMILASQAVKDRYEVVMGGAVRFLSIGFSLPKKKGSRYEIDPASYVIDKVKKIRTLVTGILWETSLATFPANTSAAVVRVKAAIEHGTEREVERALRDAGLSKTDSMFLVGIIKNATPLRDAGEVADAAEQIAPAGADEVLAALRTASARMATFKALRT